MGKNEHILTIADLQIYKNLIKLAPLAELAGLKPGTLAAKINRNTELSVFESQALMLALEKAGISIKLPAKK